MNWNKTSIHRNFAVLFILVIFGLFFIPIVHQSAVANHGKEIDLEFSDAQFLILPEKNIHQVKFTVTYSVLEPDTIGKQINGMMQISTDNGSLVKTTSIPNGFIADKTGFQQFVTSLPFTSPKTITTIVLFTDLNKTSPLSNPINRDLVLNKTQ
ncbi:MAG TPA: hypothetical protein VK566_06970 [Nitrososphaeraceae archaeon]|nr:hypothetical protein [Nitrososphaeraceae archaeon]